MLNIGSYPMIGLFFFYAEGAEDAEDAEDAEGNEQSELASRLFAIHRIVTFTNWPIGQLYFSFVIRNPSFEISPPIGSLAN